MYMNVFPNKVMNIHNLSDHNKSNDIFASKPQMMHDIDVYCNDFVVNLTSSCFRLLYNLMFYPEELNRCSNPS